MKYVVGILVFLAGLFVAAIAITYILWQHKAMTRFVATPAAVVSTHVTAYHDKHGTSYKPEVSYEYVVDGSMHQCSQIYTFSSDSGSQSSAQDVLDEFPVATRRDPQSGNLLANTTAYVNPDDPNDAILVRAYKFDPYIGAYVALFVALVGLGGAFTDVFSLGSGKMQALALDDSGWQLLLPRQNLRRRLRNALIWCVLWAVFCLPIVADWLFVVRDYSVGPMLGCLLPLGLLAMLVIAVVRRWSLVRHISDVRLRVKPAPLKRSATFALSMEADTLAALHVNQAVASIVCIEHYKERRGSKTYTGTRNRLKKDVTLCQEAVITAGQMLDGSGETVFQAEDCPETSANRKTYPYYTWEVRLAISLKGAVDYKALFPLHAE